MTNNDYEPYEGPMADIHSFGLREESFRLDLVVDENNVGFNITHDAAIRLAEGILRMYFRKIMDSAQDRRSPDG